MIARALAVCVFAAGLIFAAWSGATPKAHLAAAAASGDVALTGSNGAILVANGLAPGGSSSGTATMANTGGASGFLSLSSSSLTNAAGPYGGKIGDALVLDVADISNPSVPHTIFSGKVGDLHDLTLGMFTPGESRTYRFSVRLPDGGAPASGTSGDNALQGAKVTVEFDWTGTGVPAPPDTTPTDTGTGTGTTTTNPPTTTTNPPTVTDNSVTPPATITGPTTTTPKSPLTITTDESTKKCVSRRAFTIHLRSREPLASATVTVDGKRVKVHRGKRLTAVIDIRKLPRGTIRVRITARTKAGHTLTGTRTYHTCAIKRPSKKPPRL